MTPTFTCLRCGRAYALRFQAGSGCLWCVTGHGPIVPRPVPEKRAA